MTRATRLSCRTLAAAMCVTTVLSTLPAFAADLGVRGATWPVIEPDLLEEIEARLSTMQRSGELARLQEEARARARQTLEEPEPVPGIAPAREARSRWFDPAIVVERDIRLPDGTLIAAAGARVNPLARHALARDLLFVDGRREAEIAWALAHEQGRRRSCCSPGGRWRLSRAHGRPFFFDQGGRLAARFGIAATPSLVEQAGSRLRITEIPGRGPGCVPGRESVSGTDATNPERKD